MNECSKMKKRAPSVYRVEREILDERNKERCCECVRERMENKAFVCFAWA